MVEEVSGGGGASAKPMLTSGWARWDSSTHWLSPLKVDSVIASCSEMHDMKEAIYESKKKLEGIGEDYQIQVLPLR